MTGQEIADLSVEADVPIERPLKLCWAAINLCNLRCDYCIDTKGTPELAAENRKRVLNNLIDSGVLSIDFTGGEPTLLPDLFELMQTVREAGRGVTITTNGTRLHGHAQRLAEHVDCVRVSVDGATANTHDLLRGRMGGFRHITRGVEALRSLGIPVRINTVVMRSNVHEVDAMTALAKSMGAEQINLIQFLPVGEGAKGAGGFDVDPEAYQTAFDAAKERYEDAYFDQAASPWHGDAVAAPPALPGDGWILSQRARLAGARNALGSASLGRLLLLAILLSGCGAPEPAEPGGGDPLSRPVVLAASPLVLTNPGAEPVTWPLWGGAFTTDEDIRLRVDADSTGVAGVVIAGAGDPEQRVAVALLEVDGTWRLRETDGAVTSQEVELAGGPPFIVDVADGGVAVSAGSTQLMLAAPLVDPGLYVHLEPGAALQVTDVALSQPLPTTPSLGVPLRELASACGVAIGTATDVWPPLHDLGFEALLAEQFGTVAPTELYWATTRGEDADFFFVPADLMINFATVHAQDVTAMFLVWDFELPAWLADVAPAELGEVLDEHVTTLVSRYAGRVDAWVVVNEAIWGPDETGGEPAQYAETIWSDALGPEHIERAFRAARVADPDAVLLYNETGAEEQNEKADFLYAMASDLVARDVPIDGIGFQLHIDAGDPPDLASVRANFERFAALGLEIHITELDVSLASADGDLQLQADLYRGVVETCLAVPACRDITVFGFTDRYAWDELGDAAPLLFDESYAAKPAFFAVQSALR
jgi:endo-1,4-beta-xylanase